MEFIMFPDNGCRQSDDQYEVSFHIHMSLNQEQHARIHRSRSNDSSRRGVASVLAMMFLMIFSSLAAVMAILAQGNVQTAHSSLRISRALSAAESGLAFAARRLRLESRRFIVDQGVIDSDFGERLWLGTWVGGDGSIEVNDPDGYLVSNPSGQGLVHAIHDARHRSGLVRCRSVVSAEI